MCQSATEFGFGWAGEREAEEHDCASRRLCGVRQAAVMSEAVPPLAPGETWLLASRQDRASCLLDKDGREYFPHLLVLC